jgi:hypothetical protein
MLAFTGAAVAYLGLESLTSSLVASETPVLFDSPTRTVAWYHAVGDRPARSAKLQLPTSRVLLLDAWAYTADPTPGVPSGNGNGPPNGTPPGNGSGQDNNGDDQNGVDKGKGDDKPHPSHPR